MHSLPSQDVAHIISSLRQMGTAGEETSGVSPRYYLLVSTAATKHHSQGNIEKKSLLGCAESEVEAMAIMVGSMVAGKALEQYMRACILIPKHKAERANWEWHGFLEPQNPLQVKHLQQGPFQIAPPTGD